MSEADEIKKGLKELPSFKEEVFKKLAELKSFFIKSKFMDAKMADGTILRYEGDMPMQNMPVVVLDEAGQEVPVPDGEYELPELGLSITVAGSVIQAVTPKEPAKEEEAQPADAKTQDMEEAKVKTLIESIVKESHYSKEEMAALLKKQEDTFNAKFEAQAKELKDEKEKSVKLFELVEKIVGEPSVKTPNEKKDEFKKKVADKSKQSIEDFRKSIGMA